MIAFLIYIFLSHNQFFDIVKNWIDIAKKDNTTLDRFTPRLEKIFFCLPVKNSIGIRITELEIERIKTIWNIGKSATSVFIRIIWTIKKSSLNISQ